MRSLPIVLAACAACSSNASSTPGSSGGSGGSAAPPAAARVANWRDDLDTLVAQLLEHPRPFFHADETAWRADAQRLRDAIPRLDDVHVVTGLVHLAAALGDSHTRLFPSQDQLYPVRFLGFEDGIYVAGGDASAVGHRVTAIDHKPIAGVIATATTLVAAENDAYVASQIPLLLENPAILAGLDLASSSDGKAVVSLDGAPDLTLVPGKGVALAPPKTLPLHLQGPNQLAYWNKYDDANHLLYLAYNACEDDKREQPFAQFAAATLAYADQHRVDRFVIDLRNNTGGNSEILNPLVDGLASRPALAGRVFALIGRTTFSSAVIAASRLSTRLHATLVGAPTGGNPNGYGEIKVFTLPHSKLVGQVSSKLFADPSFHGTSIPPDIAVHVTADDWFSGRDPYLDAVLAAPVPRT
jgi:hypothetical protein|nr:hypothetical protein [Kofleriaceae bacterium]